MTDEEIRAYIENNPEMQVPDLLKYFAKYDITAARLWPIFADARAKK